MCGVFVELSRLGFMGVFFVNKIRSQFHKAVLIIGLVYYLTHIIYEMVSVTTNLVMHYLCTHCDQSKDWTDLKCK